MRKMARTKKIYQKGDKVGIWQLEFVEEIEPHITSGGSKHRQFKVICPICHNIFITKQIQLNKKARPVKQCPTCSLKENKKRISNVGKQSSNNLIGQKFGKLLVLSKTDKRYRNNVIWHCKCDCGNEKDILGIDLLRGHTTFCGCIKSRGEELISNILKEMCISFEKEKTFIDCVNPKTNSLLRFDFYLPDYNVIIEYDGEQHFKYNDTGWNTKENFKQTIYRDNIKNNYCKNNNIKLIRIPYTDFNKINQKYIVDLAELADAVGPNPTSL